ncbi:hypothetical protein ACH4JZ_18485 [Streptomyces sp. NPDC017615]|uniref:hypothetical protein n=1 Tax=Streptomyces sp. NPDC017615 TaxID=3365003 RepID=UPI00379DD4AC
MPLTTATADALAEMLRQGATNIEAAHALGIDKGTAARHRAVLGIGPATKRPAHNRSTLTVEEKFATYTQPLDNGHMAWTGRLHKTAGTPVFTHREKTFTARSIAFRVATGRKPDGNVIPECDWSECVAPGHVQDEPGRTRLRSQLAAVVGTATPLVECNRGHSTAEHRRYTPNGHPYCGTCHALMKQARTGARAQV